MMSRLGMTMGECEAPPSVGSAVQKRLDKSDDHHREVTSRTSCTYSDSWDATGTAHGARGVEVPPLLAPLFGFDFLPFSPIQEEEIDVPPMDIPLSVEISDPPPPAEQPSHRDRSESSPTQTSTKCLQRVLSPAPTPEDRAELQELLIQSSKKKKAGKRFKAAARAVFQRVKSSKTSVASSSASSKRRSSKRKSKQNDLEVDPATNSLDQQLGHSGWVSPTASALTDATDSPISNGATADEENTRKQAQRLSRQAEEQKKLMKTTQSEIEGLQSLLSASIAKYREQLARLQETQEQLAQLASRTGVTAEVDGVKTNEEGQRVLKRSDSGHFMRIHDLDLCNSLRGSSDESASLSSLSQSGHAKTNQVGAPTPEFLLMDHYLLEIIKQLMAVGYDLVTDETDRFTPTRDTAKLLSQMPSSVTPDQNGWPIQPWTPAWDDNVLVWSGHVNHDGFGHTWPVIKGRAILHTSARNALELLWNSSLVPKYNPHCQGRLDLYMLQDDVHTSEEESPYGFAGCAKIVRSLNKHRLLPKAIEMKILMHARPLEQHKGSYILVSRSVWENDSATLDSQAAKSVIRTEMLLGCSIMRAINDQTCELTQLTHVHSPGVPEMLAKKAAPTQTNSLMKTLQGLFEK